MLFFLNSCDMNIFLRITDCCPTARSAPFTTTRKAFRLIIERVKVEHRTQKHDQREDYHNAADYPVDDHDAAVFKLVAHFIDEPCQPEPPQQGSANDTEVTDAHVKRLFRNDESKLCEGSHEKEYDKRI